jgi:DNA-binding transcriptional regulator YdaS (Cro superfamily)
MDIQTLIDKAGGTQKLADLLGVSRPTVLDWKRAGFIPGNRVAQISAALSIPVVVLIALVAAPVSRKSDAA